jgi:hypothetical protein
VTDPDFLVKIDQVRSSVERTETLKNVIRDIRKSLVARNNKWVVIFDQLNALYKNPLPVYRTPPFDIVTFFGNLSGITLLASASANNEGYPVELPDWEVFRITEYRYSDAEYKLWCVHNSYVPDDDDTKSLRFWTGGIPLELDMFHNLPVALSVTMAQKIEHYKRFRIPNLIANHRKFVLTLTLPQDKKSLSDCISRMALRLPPPDDESGLDRQLLVAECDEQNIDILVTLNPVIYEAIMRFHSDTITDSLRLVTTLVFQDEVDYTNGTKGEIAERYIIVMLQKIRQYSFASYTFSRIKTRKLIRLQGKISRIVRFNGIGLPIASTIQKSYTTLIVPTSSVFPGIDFFIWDSVNNRLLAIQVTVQQSLRAHMEKCKFDWESWSLFFEIDPSQFFTLWMAPTQCIDVNCVVENSLQNYIVEFSSLVNFCPALDKLVLRVEDGADRLKHMKRGLDPGQEVRSSMANLDLGVQSVSTFLEDGPCGGGAKGGRGMLDLLSGVKDRSVQGLKSSQLLPPTPSPRLLSGLTRTPFKRVEKPPPSTIVTKPKRALDRAKAGGTVQLEMNTAERGEVDDDVRA